MNGRSRAVAAVALVTAALLCSGAAAVAQELRTTVTAPDGVRLATDVYFPFSSLGDWGTILQRTPYGKEGLGTICRFFNLYGYACVAQDERGTGASEGHYSGYLDERGDGQATVAWIAGQWWSNGKVGTFGASALGMTQYAMAPGAPSALVCQVPIVGTADIYHHAVYQGGALRYALTSNWLANRGAADLFAQLLDHRLWDAFWESWAVMPHVAEIDVPGLHVGGWYDIFCQGTLDAFTAFQHRAGPGARGRQKLIIGPWTHEGTAQATAGQLTYPSNAAILGQAFSVFGDWYDRWLKGSSTDVDDWPPARVYLMGAVGESGAPGNVWLDLADWPPRARTLSLYLQAPGDLVEAKPANGSLLLLSDPAAPVPTLGGQNLFADLVVDGRAMGAGPYDQRPIETRNDVLTFTTAPLEAPVTVMGRVRARIWVLPDTPDLDLAVRLTDVYPDGRSMLVTDGIQRARMRCGDDRECFLVPGQDAELVVDLWSTALVFNTGHRIRIDLSGSNSPRFEVNRNDGGDLNATEPGVVARPLLLFGPQHPSALELPVPGPRSPRRRLSP